MMVIPLTLLGTVCAILVLKPLAIRLGLMDRPGGHKTHSVETPLIGGIAMFIGSTIAAMVLDLDGLTPYGGTLLLGGGLLVAVGTLDDFRGLGVSLRFLVQIAAALAALFWGGIAILDLGNLLGGGDILLHGSALPLTVFAMVGAMNAMNMMDGADGLCGGMALVTLSLLSLLAWQGGMEGDFLWLLVLGSAVAGFLAFNARLVRKHASVFMGDAGSLFLGFAIALFLIRLSQGEGRAMTPVTALWVFALPLMATVAIMLRRLLKRQSPSGPIGSTFIIS